MARRVLPHQTGIFMLTRPAQATASQPGTFRRINPTKLVGQGPKCKFLVVRAESASGRECLTRCGLFDDTVAQSRACDKLAIHARCRLRLRVEQRSHAAGSATALTLAWLHFAESRSSAGTHFRCRRLRASGGARVDRRRKVIDRRIQRTIHRPGASNGVEPASQSPPAHQSSWIGRWYHLSARGRQNSPPTLTIASFRLSSCGDGLAVARAWQFARARHQQQRRVLDGRDFSSSGVRCWLRPSPSVCL
jgi:hypothetical protein